MKVAALDVDPRKRSLHCRDEGGLKAANDEHASPFEILLPAELLINIRLLLPSRCSSFSRFL
ncbi:hypothetical protein T07_1565 [Trichinella nelsoni]|uniref:Uncharacterized protein n=1 Tax=Trichinella nelsoni TaxID=6336 RepID=A0A0V0SH53_9BILA|nr:hypothetical protein T07_1565 [Trichinella nelsoni]